MDVTEQSQEQARSNAVFCHDSLQDSTTQIRLLRTLGAQHGRLHHELRIFSLYKDPPMWKALSYAEDRSKPFEVILINGKEFYVDVTLFGFLEQISQEEAETDWIFIKPICINQANTTERSQKVNMTAPIYAGASEVTVWIPCWAKEQGQESLKDKKLKGVQVLEPAGGSRNIDKEAKKIRASLNYCIRDTDYWTGLHVVQQVSLATKLTIRFSSLKADDSDVMNPWVKRLPTVLPDGTRLGDIRNAILLQVRESDPKPSEACLKAVTMLKMRADIGSSLRNGNLIRMHLAFDVFGRASEDLRNMVFQLSGIAQTHIVLDDNMSKTQLLIEVLAELVISAGMHRADSIDEWMSGGPRGATIDGAVFRDVVYRVVYFAFGEDLTNPLMFLILREICKHFAPKSEDFSQQELCTYVLEMSLRFAGRIGHYRFRKRDLLMPTSLIKKRLKREILPRIQETYLRLEEEELHNKILTSPLKYQEEETNEARSCSEWIEFVHARCDVILQRSKEGELASKSTNERRKLAP